jgi:hypothetical protein
MKDLRKKIFFTLFLLIFIFYFLFTFGFKIIFSVSTFLGNIRSKPTPNFESKEENFIGDINIDIIPQATNSASFLVQGSVLNFNEITFFLNDEKIKKIELEGETNFQEEIEDLKEGKNTFYAIAKNKEHFKKTPVFDILYKPQKPKLEISQPKDEEKFANAEVFVKGTTDKETFVKINDTPVIVDALGNFEKTITLQNEGENIIQITAQDIAGNLETKEIKVFYQK